MGERWTQRSDAWTREDDETLRAIVLTHIREGSTQLAAFVEAANALGRTPAACGYRWNGVLRKDQENAIREAKTARRTLSTGRTLHREYWRETRLSTALREREEQTRSQLLDAIVHCIEEYESEMCKLREENESVRSELESLRSEMQWVREENERLHSLPPLSPSERLSEDSRTLLEIMERARRLLGPADAGVHAPRFRMDRNGNLERVLETPVVQEM